MTDEKSPTSALRAVAHPLRLQILSLLTGTEMSAAEVARELDITHANASYHLRVLLEASELVIAGEENIRGGIAKRYRHPWNEKMVSSAPATPDDHRVYMRAVAQEMTRRYDRRKRHSRSLLSDAEMWVAPDVWEQVMEHVAQASALIHDHALAPRAEGAIHVNLTAVAFQMDDPE